MFALLNPSSPSCIRTTASRAQQLRIRGRERFSRACDEFFSCIALSIFVGSITSGRSHNDEQEFHDGTKKNGHNLGYMVMGHGRGVDSVLSPISGGLYCLFFLRSFIMQSHATTCCNPKYLFTCHVIFLSQWFVILSHVWVASGTTLILNLAVRITSTFQCIS